MKKFLLLFVVLIVFVSCDEEELEDWGFGHPWGEVENKIRIQKNNENYEMEDLISKDSLQIKQSEDNLTH